jgi:hypothetical protein
VAADGHHRDATAGTPPDRRAASPAPHQEGAALPGYVEGNARLTASTAVVLIVLLAAEGVTVLRVGSLLSLHVFLGAVVVPPVAVKVGSTTHRFVRYYQGDPGFRRKGPPALLLRLLGPVVVILTGVLLGTGVALMFVGRQWRSSMLFFHKASFVLWFGAMAVHVLSHVVETAKVAPLDWLRRTRRDVAGAGARRWLLAASLVAGLVLATYLVGRVGWWSRGAALGAL